MRATMSDGPPAAKPTIRRTGREGYDCACASAQQDARSNSRQPYRILFFIFIGDFRTSTRSRKAAKTFLKYVADSLCAFAALRPTFSCPHLAATHFPAAASTSSAPFSLVAMVGKIVFDEGIVGNIDESITRKPAIPRTLSSGSTTAAGSMPIRQVPTMCQQV